MIVMFLNSNFCTTYVALQVMSKYYVDILQLTRKLCQQVNQCEIVFLPYCLLSILQRHLINNGVKNLGARNCAEVLRRAAIGFYLMVRRCDFVILLLLLLLKNLLIKRREVQADSAQPHNSTDIKNTE